MKILSILMSILCLFSNIAIPNINTPVKPEIKSIVINKAIIKIETNIEQGQYCFQYPGTQPKEESHDWIDFNTNKFQVYKYDGKYDLYIRNKNKVKSEPIEVKINSGYHYTFDGEGVTIVKKSLSEYLKEHNDSIDNLNNYIANNVFSAGIYSREAVALAGISCISYLAEYGVAVPYMASGGYSGAKKWGVNSKWGSKLSEPVNNGTGEDNYNGMACVGGVRWVFQQAGLNINYNGKLSKSWDIGRFGEVKNYRDNLLDYRDAKTGDVAKTNSHYRILIDRLDTDYDGECESYLTIEMHKPHPYGYLTCRIISMQSIVWSQKDIDTRAVLNMQAIYDNNSKWKNSFTDWKSTIIPITEFPDYMKNKLNKLEKIVIQVNDIINSKGN